MAQVNVSHFNIQQIPKRIITGIAKLAPQHAQTILNEKHEGFLSVLSSNENTIGFAYITKQKTDSARINYIFVHPACRRNSLGSQLLHKLFGNAVKNGIELINFDTTEDTKELYLNNGFLLVKEPLNSRQHSIYHYERPDLSFYLEKLEETKSDPKRANKTPLKIPDDTHHYKYSTEQSFMSLQRCMMAQAQREILILCDNITNPIFKDHYLRACILHLSKRNSQAKIKILLEDDRTGAGYHSPIIDLAQRLSSFIEIKAIPQGSSKPGEMITCVDFDAGIYRKSYDCYAGFANFHNHLIAQRLRDNFQQHWQYAKPSLQHRRLSL